MIMPVPLLLLLMVLLLADGTAIERALHSYPRISGRGIVAVAGASAMIGIGVIAAASIIASFAAEAGYSFWQLFSWILVP